MNRTTFEPQQEPGTHDARAFGVQLASSTPHDLSQISYPVIVDGKLDGIRAIFMRRGDGWACFSRAGLELYNVRHILDVLGGSPELGGYVLDGELVAGDFADTIRYARSSRSVHRTASADVRLRLFDVIPAGEWARRRFRIPQVARKLLLHSLFGTAARPKFAEIVPVAWTFAASPGELADEYQACIDRGLEGVVVKDVAAPYGLGRSPGWMKRKPVQTEEFPIVGFEEGRGRFAGTLGAVVVDVQGKRTRVGTGYSDCDRGAIWTRRSKLLGLYLEVGFEGFASRGGLRFPRFKGVRSAPGGEHLVLEYF